LRSLDGILGTHSLQGDAAYFENQTVEGIIVMGWATYNEFAAPLHDRDNYVLTHDATDVPHFSRPKCAPTWPVTGWAAAPSGG
jgi:dihydrofolate reductase